MIYFVLIVMAIKYRHVLIDLWPRSNAHWCEKFGGLDYKDKSK